MSANFPTNDPEMIEMILFDGLSNIADPGQRTAFLDQTCRGNPELRERLEQLLVLRDEAEKFFTPEPEEDPGDAKSGLVSGSGHFPAAEADPGNLDTRVGRYRLLERLGEGGCGIVYLAEQMEPVRRRVALKIIRLGMDTENVISRFEMERQALAMMDHPNIARVYDAGTTSSGRPFFVMQWVEGEKITDFCDERKLPIPDRLALFIRVCNAIQHAHQKGVIHRDIKPSNIIVMDRDGAAVPKVIDFGIAKATGSEPGDEHQTFTLAGQFVGTPSYMSPEQADKAGTDVDTRCDIYALGALLYELLTGRPPFDPKRLQQADVEEIRRILREEEPRDPSVAVAALDVEELREVAACRACDPRKLSAILRGDLDRIVMMAMEKDRKRRYGSAESLAADVLRHLNHEPVVARPASRMYRLRRLARRNQVVFVAGTMVLLALIGGLGTSAWLFHREKQARQEQVRLREIAELGRLREAGLREAAESRGKIAQAAVQLKYGNIQAADELLSQVPVTSAQPSLESADTFRTMGEWHVAAARWKQAAERYSALVYAITAVDVSDTDEVSRDLLPAAASLYEAGDIAGYERLREIAINRFRNTTNAVVAEQLLKTCLILPANGDILATLEPSLRLAASNLQGDAHMVAWRVFAVALMDYRRNDFPAAVEWADRCINSVHKNPAREASARLLRAMAWHRLEKSVEARAELDLACEIMGNRFTGQLDTRDTSKGFWFDWVNARILRREAEALIRR
jgi:serine/threonine protein kinase/tetratricopeptide (TPR) repeat protein